MKRVISLLLVIALCLALCACGKSDEVKHVEQLIDEIGTVTVESQNAIEAAEAAYNSLSMEDKEKVGNVTYLYEAKQILSTLCERVELTIDNLHDYFSISIDTDDSDISSELVSSRPFNKYKYWGTANVSVTATLKNGIRLEDVAFVVLCKNSNTSEGESPWDDVRVLITMPANGDTTTETGSTNNVSKSNAFQYRPIFNSMKYEIVSVSGYVILPIE